MIIVIAIALVLFFLIVRPYFIRHDTVVLFTGGLGSGKSFMSTNTAVVLLRKQRIKTVIDNIVISVKNLFRRIFRKPLREKHPRPMLYSNIPLRISFRENAILLDKSHLLLQRRIVPRSVVYLDEIDGFANQFEYDNLNILRRKSKLWIDWDACGGNFDEFVRFFRHYTKGGYFVANTQCSENVNLVTRRRANTAFNLMRIRFWGIPLIWPHIIYTVRVRNITISEEIKTVETDNKEDNMRLVIGLVPLLRRYDTYCYSDRYVTVPYQPERTWKRMKTNQVIRCPDELQPKFTQSTDPAGV